MASIKESLNISIADMLSPNENPHSIFCKTIFILFLIYTLGIKSSKNFNELSMLIPLSINK